MSVKKIDEILKRGIVIYGEPILRKKAKTVKFIGEPERWLFEAMAKLMYDAQGCGLAANQAGIALQLLVIDVGGGLLKLANPRILKKEGIAEIEEGCLSLPKVVVKVKRAKKIWVEALNSENQKVTFEAQDILARALQHEMDHLNGKLIIDYASWRRRIFLRRQLRLLRKG
ncbi:MAG: peptide deformylase [Candidatus Omnitrophota bacterium]